MKVLIYSAKEFELSFLKTAAPASMDITYVQNPLSKESATMAKGYDAVSIFTGDDASDEVIQALKNEGIKFIATRAAGYDNISIKAANEAGIKVANVPEYSPHAIAEHTVAMMLALNRKILVANEHVHRHDFRVDGLVGFDFNKKKVGVIGTGRIGRTVAKIMHGFGCTILAYDEKRDRELEEKYDVFYTGLHTLCSMCDIITIHVPLTEQTKYLIDRKLIKTMKHGVMLINTSRGGIIKTTDAIDALSTGQIGFLGLDVYEKEKGIFFFDRSGEKLEDGVLQKLLTLKNVLITPHQAFATNEALKNIADSTFENLACFMNGKKIKNELTSNNIDLVVK